MKRPKRHTNQSTDYNNFDLVRTILAVIVVFNHLSVLTQITELRWLGAVFDGDFAVKGFFAISGFLVMGSYVASKSNLDFAEKRTRRIYPAYLAAIILCFIIGICASTLNVREFAASPQTLKYFISNAVFLNTLQPTLPGVFESNPDRALDGSLWTIKIEICLYFCIPFIFYFFETIGEYTTALLLIVFSIAWAYFFKERFHGSAGPEIARQFPGQLSYFVIGALLCVNRTAYRHLKLVAIAAILLSLFLRNGVLATAIEPLFYSTLVICLSTQTIKNLNFGRWGDLSFGIYLYHFPIIQLLIWSGLFSYSIYAGIAATLATTIMVSFLSWHFIEKKWLRRTSHYVVAAKI
jgi:peptidoglycan/LPS O-acetylase OafA/YrhL